VLQLAIALARGRQQLLDVAPIHADKCQRPVGTERREVLAGATKKVGELHAVHLARSHRVGPVVDRAEAGGRTIDRDVEGRAGKAARRWFFDISAANAFSSRALPHNTRWRPSRHKSPSLLTGKPARSSGTTSAGSSSFSGHSSRAAIRRSI